nr:PREDICTED: DBH-like monooxygenase protein 2 homolog [Lepisosteus oculatus]
MIALSLLLLFLCSTLGNLEPLEDTSLQFSEHLDAKQEVTVRWGFNEPGSPVTFEVTFPTLGWVGFGFSPSGGMSGADIVIGGIHPNGSTYFTDRHADGTLVPALDPQQDYTLLSLRETGTKTVMMFRRNLQTCDRKDFVITESPVHLIYAYGSKDDIEHHRGQRGGKEVNLLKHSNPFYPPNPMYFDLTAGNFDVPEDKTFVYCRIIKGPNLGQKHHIYRVEPLLHNADLSHHMLVYVCPSSVQEEWGGACYFKENIGKIFPCLQGVAGWGKGGKAFILPPDVGIPIGTNKYPSYYRLEIHYNNEAQKPGRMDNSGLRLYYTSELRQFDMGVIETGVLTAPFYITYLIPPKTPSFKSYGLCNTSEFSRVIPGPVLDLNVFGILLHTHGAGRKVTVGHFRNGEQIGFLSIDNNYDQNFQRVQQFGRVVPVKLGDEILVECTYNTEDRSTTTLNGLAATDEMCLAFLYYYPMMKISKCLSAPSQEALLSSLGSSSIQNGIAKLNSESWNQKFIDYYQNVVKEVPQHTYILAPGEERKENTGFIRAMWPSPMSSCENSAISSRNNCMLLIFFFLLIQCIGVL